MILALTAAQFAGLVFLGAVLAIWGLVAIFTPYQ